MHPRPTPDPARRGGSLARARCDRARAPCILARARVDPAAPLPRLGKARVPRDGETRFPRAIALALAALALQLAASCRAAALDGDAATVVRGPLPTRAQHPLALTLLGLPLRRATPVAEGRTEGLASVSYASLYEIAGLGAERVAFDGETARPALRLRHGLDGESDLELVIGGLYATSGFLDGFVTDWHEATHFADGGRTGAEDDQFQMILRTEGERVFQVEEDRLSLADLPIVWTRRVRHEDARGPAIAVRVGVELPTGSLERGSGNEEIDAGFGVLAEKSFGRLTVTGSVDWIHPGRPDTFEDVGADLNDLVVVQSGWEYRWSARTSLCAVLAWTSPLTDQWDFEEIDREILDLGLGFARDLGRDTRWLFSFHEDVIAATGPDFTLFTGIAFAF